ncbi:hypothetical protein EUGRSUZ_L03268 [Eucalyptus grandis]|uniref:Uncharacterized protein n=1 Tax=Eucalyptus grandis TaxID=71139 RepID=A0AAD9WHY2_EUCGR|nr:hypothetical protein EUGRSUZ_L03268 [Eucalyptus grandis]
MKTRVSRHQRRHGRRGEDCGSRGSTHGQRGRGQLWRRQGQFGAMTARTPSEWRQEVVTVAWGRWRWLMAARGGVDGETAGRAQQQDGSSDERWVVVVR